jgi:hypothetical protein
MTSDTSGSADALAVAPRVAPASLQWKVEAERRRAEVARLGAALGMEPANLPRSAAEVELGMEASEELVEMRERLAEMDVLRPAMLERSWQTANEVAAAARAAMLEQLRT